MVELKKTMRKELTIRMKNIRILLRNIRDGFKNVFRNLSLSIASISCITVTLLLVSVAIIGSLNVENFTKLISDDFTIVAFIDNKADEEKEEKILKEIKKLDNIDTIEYTSKKDVAKEMMASSDTFKSIISDCELFSGSGISIEASGDGIDEKCVRDDGLEL